MPARATLFVIVIALLTACGQRSPAGDPPDGTPVTTPEQTVSHVPGTAQPPATGSAVAGIVLDAAGKPVSGALVQPTSLDDPAKPVPELAVLTDQDGRFRWSLQPGRYRLTARLDGRSSAPVEVVVTEHTTTTADLTLR